MSTWIRHPNTILYMALL